MGPAVTRSMFLEPFSPLEVDNLINDLKNKSTLDTKISAMKIANSCPKFVKAFTSMVNSYFEQGIFPNHLRQQKLYQFLKEF